MRVGVLGTGAVGRAMGTGFVELGHEVRMGSRDPDNPSAAEWAHATGERASTGTFADAAAFGEIAVVATAWSGTENALRLAGHENFAGKVVIDPTNPLTPPAEPGQAPGLALGHTDSAGEQIQRWLPDARVVKAFNIVNNADMFHPDFPGGPADMFICGNDGDAKALVTGILTEVGWPVTDIGGIEGARLLEPLTILWVHYGMNNNTWRHAFRVVRRD